MASRSASSAGITPSLSGSNQGLATRVRRERRVVFRRFPLLKHLGYSTREREQGCGRYASSSRRTRWRGVWSARQGGVGSQSAPLLSREKNKSVTLRDVSSQKRGKESGIAVQRLGRPRWTYDNPIRLMSKRRGWSSHVPTVYNP